MTCESSAASINFSSIISPFSANLHYIQIISSVDEDTGADYQSGPVGGAGFGAGASGFGGKNRLYLKFLDK